MFSFKKIKKSLFLVSILGVSLPTISLSTAVDSNKKYTKNEITKKFFEPYYKRLGINIDLYDKDREQNEYDKVGVIEVDNFKEKLFFSKKDLEFNNLSKFKEYSMHGFAVSSLVGTDMGINKNARIYFDTIDTKDMVGAVKNMNEQFNVKLFNISAGYHDLPHVMRNYFKDFIMDEYLSLNKNNSNENRSNKNENNKLKVEIEYLNKISFSLFYYIYNQSSKLQKNLSENTYKYYKKLDEYATKNDLKIILSAGNNNEIIDSSWKNIFINALKNGYINDLSFKSLLFWATTTLKKMVINGNINFESEDDSYVNKIKNIILLKKILENILEPLDGLLDKESFFDDEKRIREIIDGSIKFQSFKSFPNLITVGAVDSLNLATNFTSYSYLDSDNLPLVSAYGEDGDDQSEKHLIYKIEKEKKNLFNQPAYYSLSEAEKKELLKNKIIEWEKLFSEETRKKLYEIYSSLTNASIEEKNIIKYLANFNGTSMAAPLVTGVISLLQSNLKRNLSLNEVKVLLASSSTYSKEKATKSAYSENHTNTTEEIWRKNNSKNKTGFGIPKYFKMKKIMDKKLLKVISEESFKKWVSKSSIDSDEIIIKNNFSHLTDTLSLTVKKDFREVIKNYKEGNIKEIANLIEKHDKRIDSKLEKLKKDLEIKENEYIKRNNVNEFKRKLFSEGLSKEESEILYEFKKKSKNYFDVYSHLILERINTEDQSTYNSVRMKVSESKDSSVERNNFGEYSNLISTKYHHEILLNDFKEFENIIREELAYIENYSEIIKNKNDKIRNKKIKEFEDKYNLYRDELMKYYKEYIKKYWEFHYYLSINGE